MPTFTQTSGIGNMENKVEWVGAAPATNGDGKSISTVVGGVAANTVLYTVPVGYYFALYNHWISMSRVGAVQHVMRMEIQNGLGVVQYIIDKLVSQAGSVEQNHAALARFSPIVIPAGYTINLIYGGAGTMDGGIEGWLMTSSGLS